MSSKPKWLQNLAEFLIDNLTILLTIGFAGYILYRQEIAQTALSTDELLAAILAVLALLATSEIVERYRRLNSIERSVHRTLSLMESRFLDRPSAIAFFRPPPVIDGQVAGANQIDLLGVTLTTTVNKQFGHLRECLHHGAQVRVLILDPDSPVLRMSPHRSGVANDEGYFRTRLRATFRDLEYLAREVPSAKRLPQPPLQPQPQPRNPVQSGSLAVRLLSYAPSFGLVSLDAGRANGTAFIEIYPHMIFSQQPAFELTAQRDGQWYTFFAQQFEQMWDSARPWEPGHPANERAATGETPGL